MQGIGVCDLVYGTEGCRLSRAGRDALKSFPKGSVMGVQFDKKTQSIIRIIEAMGFRVEIDRVKGRTKMAAISADGDEEWGIAATPQAAAMQLLEELK